MNARSTTTLHARREEVESLLAAGNAIGARSAIIRLWHEHGGPAVSGFVLSSLEKLSSGTPNAQCRVAILRSFTIEPMISVLRAAAAINGIDIQAQVGPFNSYVQEAVDPKSELYRFRPDVVFLALQARDIAPDLWGRFADLQPDQVKSAASRVGADFRSWVQAFRAHSQASVVIHNLESPPYPANGVSDGQSDAGQMAVWMGINGALSQLPCEFSGVYILDYAALVARHGRAHWFDELKWLTVRMPIASGSLIHLVNEWMRFIYPVTGRGSKVLVTDLDNTLWGGVLGEDGLIGLRLGAEYPGAIFQAVQRAMLDLHRRGILLAICSKNNEADALASLAKHPGMLLRPEHFAAVRINWRDKASNLREIAAELNVGTDSLAFFDDNPAEREFVRENLPEVTVIEMSAGDEFLAPALRDSPWFERLALTQEDRERGHLYAERRQRDLSMQEAASLEDYYQSLQQEAIISSVTPQTLARIAQLTQKTNQFNLTTRRYNEQQVVDLAHDPAWDILSLWVKDRFGDNGIVGVAMMHQTGSTCEIDNFLLSCRVIGRSLENVLLVSLAELAHGRGANSLYGWFIPTKKNAPASEFYKNNGFQLAEKKGENTRWCLDLSQGLPVFPPWIQVKVEKGSYHG